MKANFKASIYKTGINPCVDVPRRITESMTATKGYIKIKGTINGSGFTQTLVPVKNKPYRLFVNISILKAAGVSTGDSVSFIIEQDFKIINKEYPLPEALLSRLKDKNLLGAFNSLTNARKKDILKYLSQIKTEQTLQKNINKLLQQLSGKEKNVRIP